MGNKKGDNGVKELGVLCAVASRATGSIGETKAILGDGLTTATP